MKLIPTLKKCVWGIVLLPTYGLHAQYVDCVSALSCDQQYLSCGQLIRNNSFELYGDTDASCGGNIDDACCWLSLPGHQGSSDLMNYAFPDVNCSSGDTMDVSPVYSTGLIQAPPSTFPFGSPQNGYAGFFTFTKKVLTDGSYREYICPKLSSPIENGQSANISFQVTLSDYSNRATKFHITFVNDINTLSYSSSDGLITGLTPLNYTTVGPFTNRTTWVTATATWVNNTGGPVNYVIIGNVADFNTTKLTWDTIPGVTYPVGSGFESKGYYGIDDISVVKTQSCCAGKDASFIAYNTGTPASDDILMSSIYSTISNPAVNNIYIQGELILNGNYTLNNKNITFGAGSKVTVQPGKTFTTNTCHLHGCDQMWEGVYLNSIGAVFTPTNSIIEDAITGVYVNNNCYVNATTTLFRNDRVGISYNNCTTTGVNTILGCTFKSTVNNTLPLGGSNPGYLLPPYAGKRGKSGIEINNTPTIILQPALANKNYFQVLNFGVVANNSGVEVSNAEFASIYNYDSLPNILENGVGILAINSLTTGSRTIKVTDVTGQVKISSCDNGILAKGRLFTTITKSLIQNVKHRAINHSNIPNLSPASGSQLNVTTNTIKNAFEGIVYYWCGKTSSNTSNNTLQNLQEQADSKAIIVEEGSIGATSLCATQAESLPIQIINNTIDKWVTGILTNKASCINIYKNSIKLNSPSNVQHHGMRINQSPYNVITDNTVTGNYKDWQCIGVRIWASPGLHVGCNTIDNNGVSFFLEGDNKAAVGSKFGGNSISNYNSGFLFVAAAKIGKQYAQGGTNFAMLNSFDKTVNTDFEFVAEVSVSGGDNIFYFKPGTSPNTNVNNLWGKVINYSGTAVPGLTGSSNMGPFGNFPVPMTTYLVLNENIINQLGYIGFNGCGGRDSLPLMVARNFSDGSVSTVSFNEDYMYRAEHDWMYKNDVFRDYQLIKNTEWDAQMPVTEKTYLDQIKNSNIPVFYQVESLLSNYDYDGALAVNQSIQPQNEYEVKLQQINTLLIPEWKSAYNHLSGYTVPDELKDQVFEIAKLCKVQYGEAVLKARIFIREHVDPSIEILDQCDALFENRSMPVSNTEVDNGSPDKVYSLYPNPTTGLFNLSYTAKEPVFYSITDVLGKEIFSGIFTELVAIDTQAWKNGVYFVKLKSVDKEQTLRVVVQN